MWFVFCSSPGQERIAAHSLSSQLGLPTFLPLWRREPGSRVGLAFPRYGFVEFDFTADPWTEIFRLRGIKTLLGSPGRPTPLPAGAVEGLQAVCERDGWLSLEAPPIALYAPGDLVMLTRGSFSNQTAKVLKHNAGLPVLVELVFLGRTLHFEIPAVDMKRAT